MQYLRELKIRYTKTRKKNLFKDAVLHCPEDTYKLFKGLVFSDKEVLLSVHLNSRMRINCYEIVSVGTKSACLFSPAEILKGILLSNSCGFILIHNHPSGDPEPSLADLEAMRQMEKAARLLGIAMADYIVIGSESFWSRAGNRKRKYKGK